jgi:hypothetical protein
MQVGEAGDTFHVFLFDLLDLLLVVSLEIGRHPPRGLEAFGDVTLARPASVPVKRIRAFFLKRGKDFVGVLGAIDVAEVEELVAVPSQEHENGRQIGDRDN